MYLDRRLPDDLLALLLPGRALAGLVPGLSSPVAASVRAHVQTRRDRGGRRRGSIQIYLGRTSPLDVRAGPRGRLRLHADVAYRKLSYGIFDRDVTVKELGDLRADLETHLEIAAAVARASFVEGEAVYHAGMMRRYGPLAAADAPWVALDSEVRVGFDAMADQVAFEAALPGAVGLPEGEDMPRKLDALGLDRRGRVLVIEVKADAGGLGRAAWQTAVHMARLGALIAVNPSWPEAVLADLARQRAAAGLLGAAAAPAVARPAVVVPVIAAPDERAEWAAAWRAEVAPVVAASRGLLDGLRLWRVDGEGAVVEDVAG